MSMVVQVQECRVVLGVFGSGDVSPQLYMGTCEGQQHVEALVATMTAAADRKLGVRDRQDFFWSGSFTVKNEVID